MTTYERLQRQDVHKIEEGKKSKEGSSHQDTSPDVGSTKKANKSKQDKSLLLDTTPLKKIKVENGGKSTAIPIHPTIKLEEPEIQEPNLEVLEVPSTRKKNKVRKSKNAPKSDCDATAIPSLETTSNLDSSSNAFFDPKSAAMRPPPIPVEKEGKKSLSDIDLADELEARLKAKEEKRKKKAESKKRKRDSLASSTYSPPPQDFATTTHGDDEKLASMNIATSIGKQETKRPKKKAKVVEAIAAVGESTSKTIKSAKGKTKEYPTTPKPSNKPLRTSHSTINNSGFIPNGDTATSTASHGVDSKDDNTVNHESGSGKNKKQHDKKTKRPRTSDGFDGHGKSSGSANFSLSHDTGRAKKIKFS